MAWIRSGLHALDHRPQFFGRAGDGQWAEIMPDSGTQFYRVPGDDAGRDADEVAGRLVPLKATGVMSSPFKSSSD